MESKSKFALKVALISQLIAVCVHTYLTTLHYQLKLGLSDGKGLCNISDFLNCDVANTSAYSVVLGSPLALWGLFTNLALLILLSIYWMSSNKEFYRNFCLVISFLTIAASVVMGVISLTKVNAICIFCFLAYAISFVTFLSILKIKPETKHMSLPEFLVALFSAQYIKGSVILFISIPIMTYLVHSMVMKSYAEGSDRAVYSSISEWKNGKNVDLSSIKGMSKGPDISKAKMVIVEFADFQCIHCKQAQPILSNFVRSRPDVAFVFQSFPLDGVCNAAITRQGDGKSCELAKASYCAWKQNKGWEIHDWTYENFGHVDLSELTNYAQSIGINTEEFLKCRALPETTEAIREQASLGSKAGVLGTPSVFVNGRYLPGGHNMLILEAAYNELK